MSDLLSFVRESNRIESIHRRATRGEVEAHETFLGLDTLSVADLEVFVLSVAGRPIRSKPGMNVYVAAHKPPPGGRAIVEDLAALLTAVNYRGETPYEVHQQYEHLHPFMDGNGRSGRVLWAWHRRHIGRDPFTLGFLHAWYYESLEAGRENTGR